MSWFSLEKEQQQNETEKLQQQFEDIYKSEYEEVRYKKPSEEVMAYYNVYHRYPKGHPPGEDQAVLFACRKNAVKISVMTGRLCIAMCTI